MIGEKLFRIFDGEDCNLSQFMEKIALLDPEFQTSYANFLASTPGGADQVDWDLFNLLDLHASLAFLIGFVIGGDTEITQKDALSEIKEILSTMRANNVLPYWPVTMDP